MSSSQRRQLQREQAAARRAANTSEQVEARREQNRLRAAARRANERAQRIQNNREPGLDQHRRQLDAQRQARARANETAEESEQRREENSQRQATARAQETIQETERRRVMDAQRQAVARQNESLEESNRRRNSNAQQMAAARFRKVEHFIRAGLNYSPTEDYAASNAVNIGEMDVKCRHCNALKFKGEPDGMCCSGGKIFLPTLPQPPDYLKMLLFKEDPIAQTFLTKIRQYNSMFQMTSFGADKIVREGFMPTCRIQGQVYHRIGSLLPEDGQQAKYLQLYFSDSKDEEIAQRMRALRMEPEHREIVAELQAMLDEHNGLVRQFKSTFRALGPTQKIRICADKTPPNEHERRYNAPTTSEVAIILSGERTAYRDIVIEQKDGHLKRIVEIHPAYDALQYPLIFWDGRDGYHVQIPQVQPGTRNPVAKTVSCKQFYAYHLMIRQDEKNPLLYYRELFQQFLTDMYAKIETERLNYIRFNQSKLRADEYIHLRDAVRGDGLRPDQVGTKVILPSSFTGSPRHMHLYAQDALCFVRKHGRPCLFFTFTCNPKWPEIMKQLHDGLTNTQRDDIVARVFEEKRDKFNKLLKVLYGDALCFMYTIEWQKRGLPHTHALLWLREKIRPEQVDNVIWAEIPHQDEDPRLFEIVTNNMLHGPCGQINPTSPCMKNGQCSKRYPKQFISETRTDNEGYPLYRRRSPEENGQTFRKKIKGQMFTFDNRHVAPYSPILCKIFDAHINVEFCHSVKAIKYICKYIYKGSDQAVFEISNNSDNATPANDEIHNYQVGRYINSNEAVWRILGFSIHDRYPAVTQLQVHLENGERVYFTPESVDRTIQQRRDTTLTAFFKLNQEDEFARTLLYADVPSYYTWQETQKKWKRRERGRDVDNWPGIKFTDTLGRVYAVHPAHQECFYLRLLLHNVRGATSFVSIRTVDDFECPTYKQACLRLGLLEEENHLINLMKEAEETKSPGRIRDLFAIVLTTYFPARASDLWDKYKDSMSEDILFRLRREHHDPELAMTADMHNEALVIIEDKVLMISGKSLSDFGIVQPVRNRDVLCAEVAREKNYDRQALLNFVEERRPQLENSSEQLEVYNKLKEAINSSRGSISFLDAPGGTGKTFLLNLLLAEIRSNGEIALATASSGIAATLLDGGRTAHSTFAFPLNLSRTDVAVCAIKKQSGKAKVLQECKLIVWDECTMCHKKGLELLDATLRDLRDSNELMGGVAVILAGDFRQTLPIIDRGTPADEIDACFKKSILWHHVKQFRLTVNMRAMITGDPSVQEFSDELLQVGNGQISRDEDGFIEIPDSLTNKVNTRAQLLEKVYPGLEEKCNLGREYHEWLCVRAILAPKNDIVNDINSKILEQLPGDMVQFKSFDKTVEESEAVNFPVEFLNSQNPSGLPQHDLKLKVGAPIILLRNLDAPRLCNGTRLCVTDMKRNLIEAVILTGCAKNTTVLIPRIPVLAKDLPFPFKRVQFPVRLAFSMTINKSQGQSLQVMGTDLEVPCFSHGQLYVACSRVGSKSHSYVFVPSGSTKNVVYTQVLDN